MTHIQPAGDACRLQPIQFEEFLLERHAIDEAELLDSLAEHWSTGKALGDVLATRGCLEREEFDRLSSEFASRETVYI